MTGHWPTINRPQCAYASISSVMPQMVPPKWVPLGHLWQIILLWMVPRNKYGCHKWSPQTICGAVSSPPLPQMVPLILSLEMMSRGSYEVNLANMDRACDYNYHL